MSKVTVGEIDALLPQTQCGLCGFGGCLPYAKALVSGKAAINLCPPGGVATLEQLAEKLAQDAAPFIEDMATKTKPPTVAFIDEQACIGCTKCLPVCPTDAIVGGAKHLHTVIQNQCTGCELCIPACPVDCITLLPTDSHTAEQRDQFRQRYLAKQKRMQRQAKPRATFKANKTQLQDYIYAAMQRVRNKKESKS